MIEGGGKRSDFILLLKLHSVIVISGRNLTRAAGQLQYRSGNAARDPQAKYGGYAQAKQRQDQVESFKSKIGREFLVERSLQQRHGACVLGRKRDDVTNENFPGEAQIITCFGGSTRLRSI